MNRNGYETIRLETKWRRLEARSSEQTRNGTDTHRKALRRKGRDRIGNEEFCDSRDKRWKRGEWKCYGVAMSGEEMKRFVCNGN